MKDSKNKFKSEKGTVLQKYIIITPDALKNVFFTEKEKYFAPNWWLLTISLTFFICWLGSSSFTEFLGLKSDQIKLTVLLISIFCLLLWIILFAKSYWSGKKHISQNFDWKSLFNSVVSCSANKPAKNLIFLFIKKENDTLKFLVQRKFTWGNSYFFPYINDNFKEDLSESRDEVKSTIVGKLAIPENISYKIHHLTDIDFNSIKQNSDKIPQEIYYRFVLVSPSFPFQTNSLYSKLIKRNNSFEWRSLSELCDDSASMANNADVIDRLQQYYNKILSEYNSHIENLSSKIVWNYDKNCHKGCKFCAYGNNTNAALTKEEKLKIIDALNGCSIPELDIAVGDNVDVFELTEIIKKAKRVLPKTKISLTATSSILTKILSAKKNIILDKTINCVDLSIDAFEPSENERLLRIDKYNENNYAIAKKLKANGINVRVQCVITEHTTVKSLKRLINKLKIIGIDDVLLIRMMPVGKLNKDLYPTQLLEKNIYIDLINGFGKTKGVRFHCSLRGLRSSIENKITCDMGCQKLGISMTGDLFSCPWAEHLPEEDNPFHLGNLITAGHIDELIIDNENYNQVIDNKTKNQPHCKIFSFIYGEDPYSLSDQLYQ